MTSDTLQTLFKNYKESHLYHRYIYSKHIRLLIEKHRKHFKVETIGMSVLGEPIPVIQIGSGTVKILMWSQMHGNESTTTKAVFDLCNVFADENNDDIQFILKQCTIAVIPILNPDGAKAYTRVNANDVDLNRDAQHLTQPESKVLRQYFDTFNPDFCFNLHGQRTIFSAGNTNNPATVSFLAPAQDEVRSVTEPRKKAMEIIVVMNENLQHQIPNQIGIYDDTFNINCVGDMFQSLNVPTILFEAGHYQDDYARERVREYIFQSLFVAVHYIAVNGVTGNNYEPYFEIPQNEKLFYDILIRNAAIDGKIIDVAIQYRERLIANVVEFIPIEEQLSDDAESFFGHREIDAKGKKVILQKNDAGKGVGEIVFVSINDEKLTLKPKKM